MVGKELMTEFTLKGALTYINSFKGAMLFAKKSAELEMLQ